MRQRVSGGTVERWPEHPCGWRMAAPRDELHHLGAPHPNRGQQQSRANPTWAEENPADFMPRTLPVPSPPPIKLTPQMSPEAARGQGRRLGELGRGAAPPHSRPPTRGSQNGPCRPAKACAHLPAPRGGLAILLLPRWPGRGHSIAARAPAAEQLVEQATSWLRGQVWPRTVPLQSPGERGSLGLFPELF